MKRNLLSPWLCALLLVSCGSSQSAPPSAVGQPVKLTSQPVAHTIPPPPSVAALAEGALLFDDLGTYGRVINASPEAQKYFDQGLRLTYAFNHDEATRSFAKAAELDPSCAMCFWGAALTLGPNYNVPMLPDRAKAAWDALQRARALSPGATPADQALIGALASRYGGPEPLPPPAMQPFNVAYADAMRGVSKQFPDDLDIQVLFAEAMMDIKPWKLWTLDGKPASGTNEIVTTLELVLSRAPMHPGANHYYIHAIEASPHPERGVAAAERLGVLMPGAGHLVHMPAHIFQRVGRYADASTANERAVAADLAYMKKTHPPGYYPMYLGHNYGFLSFSASMEGRSALSLAAAREATKAIPPAMLDLMPGMDFFVAEPLLAMVRFGRWDELLAEPRPDPKYLVLTSFWLHGHGMALAAKGRLKEAHADQRALLQIAATAPEDLRAGQNEAKEVFMVAAKVLEARIATLEKARNALDLWHEAVDLADKLAYSEPDDWFYPVRHYLGAALLGAGRPGEAEAVYREDLRQHPQNGWALFGLWQSLVAQKRTQEALAAKEDAEKAWPQADIRLASTAY